jgi:NAD(P)-dependent dehydrogenase (short-subunit alcohol dehydrogenase family)
MAKQPRLIAGQNAAITGAARGIGRATAQAFLAAGLRVAIGDVDLAAARQTAAELGPRTVALALDVTDRDSFSRFLDASEEQLGPLDVLVNNAGIMPVGRFLDEDDLSARRTIDIDVHGVIFGMKLALARMIPRDRGHIVNVASQAGKFGTAGIATYSAAKHAVVGLSEAVRAELRLMGANIDLSYVMPYIVNTELGGGLGQARGFSNVEPSEVADAIVEALRCGTVEVWVPKSTKRAYRLGTLLPRSVAEGIGRVTKVDRIVADADMQARHDYELRAANSEPALAPAPEPAQIAEQTSI